jgi:hypothetical protein
MSGQLSLFNNSHKIIDEIKEIDVDSMTPLEAITRLYQLKRKVAGSDSDKDL